MVMQRVLFWLYTVLMDLCQWTDWGCWRLFDWKCVVFTVCSVTDSCQWTDWGCRDAGGGMVSLPSHLCSKPLCTRYWDAAEVSGKLYEVKLRILRWKPFWFVPVASKQPDLCVIQSDKSTSKEENNKSLLTPWKKTHDWHLCVQTVKLLSVGHFCLLYFSEQRCVTFSQRVRLGDLTIIKLTTCSSVQVWLIC